MNDLGMSSLEIALAIDGLVFALIIVLLLSPWSLFWALKAMGVGLPFSKAVSYNLRTVGLTFAFLIASRALEIAFYWAMGVSQTELLGVPLTQKVDVFRGVVLFLLPVALLATRLTKHSEITSKQAVGAALIHEAVGVLVLSGLMFGAFLLMT